jgi:acetyl-CoA hydrolase
MKQDKVRFVSGCSLLITKSGAGTSTPIWNSSAPNSCCVAEITNSPEIVRRIGIVSINTAIEVDVAGNVNSTHVLGRT